MLRQRRYYIGYQSMRASKLYRWTHGTHLVKNVLRPEAISRPVPNVASQPKRDSIKLIENDRETGSYSREVMKKGSSPTVAMPTPWKVHSAKCEKKLMILGRLSLPPH